MEWLVIAPLVIFVAALVDVVRVASKHARRSRLAPERRPPLLP
jgi:hypothetical protein